MMPKPDRCPQRGFAHRDADAAEQRAAMEALVLALEPHRLLAHAIAEFQADLAAADGPCHRTGVADPRLGALVLRSVAALIEIYGEQQKSADRDCLSAVRQWLLQGCDAALAVPQEDPCGLR